MDDVNLIFQAYLAENADRHPLNFEPLLSQHPNLRESLEKKIKAYEKVIGVLGDPPVEATHSSMVGREIGGCKILQVLGQGGMGVVYLGRQEKLGRDVVFKVLRPFAIENEALKERFLRESRTIGRLNHKNIVPVYDVGEDNGSFFIIMKHLAGLPLSFLIQKLSGIERAALKMTDISAALGGKILNQFKTPTEFFCALIIQVAEAVQYAHDNGVIHRDIKPSNIIIEPDGNPILLDFGLSHDEIEKNLTLSGEFLGTPIYSAPELFNKGAIENNRLLDVYSLGVTLYEMMTGGLPYEGDSIYEIYSNIKNKEPARPKSKWKGIPRDLETVISTAISKVSAFRYQSVSNLREDLDHFLQYQPITATSPSAILRLVYFARRKKKWIASAGIGLVIAGLSIGGYYYRQYRLTDTLQISVKALLRDGKIDQAITTLREATSYISIKTDTLWSLLGGLQGATGDYDEAIKSYSKALSVADKPEYYRALGMFHLYADDLSSAESIYMKGIVKAPKNGGLLTGLSFLHILKGKYDLATTYAKRAYSQRNDPGPIDQETAKILKFYSPPEALLSTLFMKLGYPHLAEKYIRSGLQEKPFNPYLLKMLSGLPVKRSDQTSIESKLLQIGQDELHISGASIRLALPLGWLRMLAVQQAFGEEVLASFHGPTVTPEDNLLPPMILIARIKKESNILDQSKYFNGKIIRRFQATTFKYDTETITNHSFKKYVLTSDIGMPGNKMLKEKMLVCEVAGDLYLITAFALKDTFEHYAADIASMMNSVQFDEENKFSWKDYRLPDGNFKISLPVSPIYYQWHDPPQSSFITDSTSFRQAQFSAIYFPNLISADMDKVRKTTLKELSHVGVVISDKILTVNGMNGLEVQFTMGTDVVWRRIIIIPPGGIMITIAQPADTFDSGLVQRFFDSFALSTSNKSALTKMTDFIPVLPVIDRDQSLANNGDVTAQTEIIKSLSASANDGNRIAMLRLGQIYEDGVPGTPTDWKIADEWYGKAFQLSEDRNSSETEIAAEMKVADSMMLAEQGNAEVQNNLGSMYYHGKGVPKDLAKAVEWYQKAAAQGNADAQRNLGSMYNHGKGVPKDLAKAVELYQKAAAQGNSHGQNNLALMYLNGEGVPRDLAKAVELYQKAAAQGNVAAQFSLGWTYANGGEGVPKDEAMAAEWYQKAAVQGDADSQVKLGWMYAKGDGVPKDATKAAEWFQKAAVHGNAEGQGSLAPLYYHGNGVSKDKVLAYAWIVLYLSNNGDPKLGEVRDSLEKELTASELAEAKALSSNWKIGEVLTR